MARAPISVGSSPAVDVAFLQASDVFEATVARIPEGAWDSASPCAGWTIREVVGHVVGTMIEASAIVRGDPFSRDPSRPGEATGDDPVSALRAASGAARAAVRTADLARATETPRGRGTVAEALAFPAADLAVHAWDVAHASRWHLLLPDELLAHVVHTAEQVPEEVLRGPGLFGPAQPVADDAGDTTRLMAWFGRDLAR
jgi:uncharacterized protein (TIGR03086 family)